jgi:hypothetical protein
MQISFPTDLNIRRMPTNIGSQSTSFGARMQVSFPLWVLRQSKRKHAFAFWAVVAPGAVTDCGTMAG